MSSMPGFPSCDGVPMRSFTASHSELQVKTAEKICDYLRKGLNKTEASRLARTSRQWLWVHRDLVDQVMKSRKAS